MSSLRTLTSTALGSLGLLGPVRRVRSRVATPAARSHVIGEYLYRLPNPWLKLRWDATTPRPLRPFIHALRRDGIVSLPGFIQGDRLRRMQESFDRTIGVIASMPPSDEQPAPPPWQHVMYREQAFDPEIQTTFTNDPFKFDRGFLELALDDSIVGIVARYLGRRFILQQAIASRYHPTDKRDFGSWQWHHDAWGRKINVMVLFTDVTLQDQYMSYLAGSHGLIHSYERTVVNSRFTEAEVQGMGFERVDCVGSAGTVFIFDSNGFHRGNRSSGAYRDTLISCYNAGRYAWKFTIPRSFVDGLSGTQQSFLERSSRTEYV
jgi:hypothetical protein